MKLKTIKDLFFQRMSINPREDQIISKVNEDLKQEAIKWVKDVMNKDPEKWYIRCEVIMHFHNITEEDLK